MAKKLKAWRKIFKTEFLKSRYGTATKRKKLRVWNQMAEKLVQEVRQVAEWSSNVTPGDLKLKTLIYLGAGEKALIN